MEISVTTDLFEQYVAYLASWDDPSVADEKTRLLIAALLTVASSVSALDKTFYDYLKTGSVE